MSFAFKNRVPNNGSAATAEDEKQTLLVFGYSCKLFKDDEKALFVDQGKHLIPWMGDETLKIDRYDCRGALSDLKSVEAQSFSQSRWEGLTTEEKKIEQLCDEERYKSLNDKSEEESIYQEEELKRLHQALNNDDKEYGQVGYKYEDDSSSTSEVKTANDTDYDPDLEEAFIPPRELEIPSNMHVPPTKKLNAIIEKTALFISKHGAQMEVLLKAKQAHNPQFEFLSYDQPLYPYYQHVLSAIRSCRYNPTLANDSAEDDSSNEDSYLHPSLLKSAKQPETTPFIPNITYKPSADCSYSLLVNKIKEKQSLMPIEETIANEVENVPINAPTSEFDGLTKSARRRLKKKLVSQSVLNASTTPETGETDDNEIMDEISSTESAATDNKTEETTPNIIQQNTSVGIDVPPNDLQIIIDKMASYVTKNGKQFEETARKRQDPRLKFLEPDDCFNAYYTQKLKLYATIKRLEQTAPSKSVVDSKTSSKLPVCFSLKKQKESETVDIKKSALDDSSNDMSDDDYRKDHSESNHTKTNKSSSGSVKKNPLQNSAKLAEERLKDKLAMAAKEKLAILERERTKKEKEKIQAERKRKAAQFLASMKIVSSSNTKSNSPAQDVKSEIILNSSSTKCSVPNNFFTTTSDHTPFSNGKNSLPTDVIQATAQSSSSKIQDIISIGSSDEDPFIDVLPKHNINGNHKSSKMSLQSRLQETLTKDEKRKRENNEKDKDHCKRIKQRLEEIKEKSPNHRHSSLDKDRSSRHSKKSHSSHHGSSKDRKKDRSSRQSKHKHKSKKSKKHTRNHNSSGHHSDSSDSSNSNNSHYS